jgi:hypothetical protein
VISFSLYVNEESDIPLFLEGLKPNLEKIPELYPGWLVRVYSDLDISNHSYDFLRSYDCLFWCDIENIPEMGERTAGSSLVQNIKVEYRKHAQDG